MFDGIASRYDRVNDVLSFGCDQRWRGITADAAHATSGETVLDVGVGTGKLADVLVPGVRVVGVDLSAAMLMQARRRASRVLCVQGSALAYPFGDGTFDALVSAFVLRNLGDLSSAFEEMARVLRAGGRIALLDITQPRSAAMRVLFNGYLGAAAPLLGRLVCRSNAYHYLVRSVTTLPPAEVVCRMLEGSGFEHCSERPLTAGMTTLWTAVRA
jgi:demethylmenaquinone methyltransferase/2-methoxy-6-polyprenyl-1,4-benzoquinol methylase